MLYKTQQNNTLYDDKLDFTENLEELRVEITPESKKSEQVKSPTYSWANTFEVSEKVALVNKNILSKDDFENTQNYLYKLFSYVKNLNLKEFFTNLIKNIKSENKFNIIFAIILFIFLYLDMFIARLSLDYNSSTAYIFISLFCKIFIISSYFNIKNLFFNNIYSIINKLNLPYIFSSNLNVAFTFTIYTFYFIYFYAFFNSSKFIITAISIGLFTEFHTSLPYIFASNLICFSVLKFLYSKKLFLNDNKETLKVSLYTTLFIIFIAIIMLSFFYTNSLETVSFFISGISLMLLTLFYHLFYRLNIYIQMA